MFEDDLNEVGGSKYLLISKEILRYLGADEDGKKVIVKTDKGKHGRFIAFWIK